MQAPMARAIFLLLFLETLLWGCEEGTRQVPNNKSRSSASRDVNAAVDDSAIGGENSVAVDTGGKGAGTAGARGDALGQAGSGATSSATKIATPIVTNDALWVERATNSLGIQGPWTASIGVDSSLGLTKGGESLCMSGTTAKVLQLEDGSYDYANYGGAVATLEVCRASATDSPPDVSYPLGTCPFAPNLAKTMVGVRFTIAEGATFPRRLRVVFKERGRTASPYVEVDTTAAGPRMAMFSEASVPTDSSAPPLDVSNLESIQFYAFPSRGQAMAFDVCLSSLEFLEGAGWGALPDWIHQPGPGMKVDYAGVNLACAEFGQQNLPGTYGTDYTYPSAADIDIYSKYHMNIIRLPFRWERLQRTLGGALDATELSRLKSTVQYANGLGMTVILDPHNFARYATSDPANPGTLIEQLIGTDIADVAPSAFADFWGRLAAIYKRNSLVMFGLVNEPHDMPTEDWLVAANAAIAAIRAAGANNLVLVPGNGWTGAHSWVSGGYGAANADVLINVEDPANNFVFEMHQYLDSDNSGTHAACVNETIGVARVTAATEWLRANGLQGFLGEFNGGANETCYQAIDGLVAYLGQNSDVWLGWAVWAGGPWWGENILTVQPRADGKERPQMTVLKRHLPRE